MHDSALIYRDQIMRAVGVSPVRGKEADDLALSRICERLVEAEEVHELLRANGIGRPGDSLGELVRALLATLNLGAAA